MLCKLVFVCQTLLSLYRRFVLTSTEKALCEASGKGIILLIYHLYMSYSPLIAIVTCCSEKYNMYIIVAKDSSLVIITSSASIMIGRGSGTLGGRALVNFSDSSRFFYLKD